MKSLDKLVEKKPHTAFYLDGYSYQDKKDLEDVFGGE
jgi:hypothetical protein